MFRLSRLMKRAKKMGAGRAGSSAGHVPCAPVVIWNLTKTCNLSCLHCYSSSSAGKFGGELSHDEALRVVNDLEQAGVKLLILSGGEPLMRQDVASIASRAKDLGMSVSLSTNGTLINNSAIGPIIDAGFDYVGVSLDGSRETHDRFRGVTGAYDKAVKGVSLLKKESVKTGVRFTMTKFNVNDLPDIFALAEKFEIDKLYLSHLVYSGRGDQNRSNDISHAQTRRLMEYVFEKAESYVEKGFPAEIVTGNNDADGAFLILWLLDRYPETAGKVLVGLEKTGGNSAGVGIANIDSRGDVHPDPLIQYINLGNVKRTPFGAIWNDSGNEILKALRSRPRKINGRCGGCRWIKVCGGNNRERAWRMTGDFWASDPACYLTDEEIRVETACAI